MFRTELTITPQERLLSRTARVLTVGSCFADSIGERLRLSKVNALVNPFGTVFQPLALAQLLRSAAGEEQDWQQHVVEARGRWQSYDFHGTIGAESPVELLQIIQEKVRQTGEFLRTADAVVLTLGTAWVYRLRETGELVSNLHKLPAGLFEKELLTADELVNALAEVHALLRRVNPDIHIVLTVSPVRHLKDTLPLNAVSKSVLRVACHYLSELLPQVSYFPAYELLTDDLRDYRFYAADMLHPSEAAEDYIWERFARTYFDADFGHFRKEWAAVRQSLGHRPLHPGAPEHRTFLDQTRERLERLATQGVDVRPELRDVQRQLAALPPPRPARVPEVAPDDNEERIDIGTGDSGPAAAPAAQLTDATQPSRRRDNRRNDRTGRDRRDNRPAAVPPAAVEVPVEEPATLVEATPEESVAASVEVLLIQPEAELLLPTEEAAYPAKKKKRRSRGGAKRTARKNAARLAAEQETGALATDKLDIEAVTEAAPFNKQAAEAVELAAELPIEEVLPVPVGFAEPTTTLADKPLAEVGAGLDDAAGAAQPRKRGTGPTPKKSKVITKSGLVKRGQRNSLYRTAAPELAEESAAAPATAPIISPPIISEVFLERPATDFTVPPPATEVSLAATVLGLYSTKPTSAAVAPPKRGRPKAGATAAAASELTAAEPTGALSNEPAEPATKAAAPAAKAPAKKAAARPAKAASKTAATAKAATAKKATAKPAKPAAPRRGRPPGKNAPPPADDAPAT